MARAQPTEEGAEDLTGTLNALSRATGARRVRFLDISVEKPRVGWIVATSRVEWEDATFEGRAEGEAGMASELRVAALATTRALEHLLGGQLTLSVVGIKSLRIFDQDLVATLLHSPQAADRNLIGVAFVTSDICHSAALAVLNATNRLLGNYLTTSD